VRPQSPEKRSTGTTFPGKEPHPRSCRTPKYRHYKPKNLAVVRLGTKDWYLGKYDSPESHEKYHRLVAEWLSGNQLAEVQPASEPQSTSPEPTSDGYTIGEMIVAYWGFAENFYSRDGKITKELKCIREALRPLRDLYASRTEGGSHHPDLRPSGRLTSLLRQGRRSGRGIRPKDRRTQSAARVPQSRH
jgi:hypothetical protein